MPRRQRNTIRSGSSGVDSRSGSLPRAARILGHLARSKKRMSIRAMSESLDIPKTTLHRVLDSLVKLDLLEVTADGLYGWGPELRTIATAVKQTHDLSGLASPILREISDRFNETMLLSIYDAKTLSIIFIEQAQGRQPIRYHPTMDIPRPIHAGASGRSVMAFLPPTEIERIVANGLPAITNNTITDTTALMADLQDVRAKGYAVSKGERTVGAVGIGCPILGRDGAAVGGIMMTIPEYRYRRSMEKGIATAIHDGARWISRQLGFQDPDGRRPTSKAAQLGGRSKFAVGSALLRRRGR
jgi:IclR family acetate operon transcriptional repressor